MSVLMEFSIFPTDKGESVSEYVSRVIRLIDGSGFPYRFTSMGTIVETETMEDALKLLEMAEQALSDCGRVFAVAKFDIRRGKSNRLAQKVKSVEKKLGKKLST